MKRPEKRFGGRISSAKKSTARPAVIPRPPDMGGGRSGRARDLAHLSELLNENYSETRVRAWVNASAARRDSFEGLTLGTIRWPKSIGRPGSSTLAEGFVVQHFFHYDIWYIGLNGEIIEKEGWLAGLPPSVWDATDDGDHYRVNYLFNAGNRNKVEVKFSKVAWPRPGNSALRGYRWMHPNGFEFESDRGLTFLPQINIDLRLLIRA